MRIIRQERSLPRRQRLSMEATRSRSRVLHSREKELIYSVNKYFLEEKANRGPIIPPSKPMARTAKATNVSQKTVQRICSAINKACDTQQSPEPPTFSSPTKSNRASPVTDLDDFGNSVVRRTVLAFYERKEIPTMHKIREEQKENIQFT